MTSSLELLAWIAASILLQLAIYLGIVFWRHWTRYLALRQQIVELDIPVSTPKPVALPDSPARAWDGLRTFAVARKTMESADQAICSFELIPQDGQALPAFLPGQFLTFHLDIPSPDLSTESVVRCYSLSDAPHPAHYRVSIKRAPAPQNSTLPPGRSSNYFHDHVQEGSLLQVRAPGGHFYLDRSDAPVVLIGGGVGITPMLSMLNWCLAEQPGREIWLFYGVRHGKEMVMRSHFETLAAAHPHFHLHICLSHPAPDDFKCPNHLHQGRVDVALLRQLLPLKPFHFYLCGPTPMLETLVPALEDWGVPDAHIHFEAFGPASVKRKKPATTTPASRPQVETSALMVTFGKSGKQLPWDSSVSSLLDFAEANGIQVSSGCRAGGCGSCQTTIQSGEVIYDHAPDFDPEPGSCLMCVCKPRTNVTLEA